MKFLKIVSVGAVCFYSSSSYAIEFYDTGITTMLLTSKRHTELCPPDSSFVGTVSTSSGSLGVSTDAGNAELFRFNNNNGTTATYKSYIARSNWLFGRVSGSFVRESNNDPTESEIFNKYQFSGILNTNKYQNELSGTYTHTLYGKFFSDHPIDGRVERPFSCVNTYRYVMALSNPLTSKPIPVSPSVISTLTGVVRNYVPTKSRNTLRVKRRTTCCGVRG